MEKLEFIEEYSETSPMIITHAKWLVNTYKKIIDSSNELVRLIDANCDANLYYETYNQLAESIEEIRDVVVCLLDDIELKDSVVVKFLRE